MNEYKLPDVGEGLTEAEIVSWRVKVGDVVKVNDIVCEIETAKSLVELPSPYAGTVAAIHVPEGRTVPVGTPILSIGDRVSPGSIPLRPAAGTAAAAEGASASAPPAAAAGEEQRQPTLVGYGPRATAATRRRRRGGATPPSRAGEAAQEQVQSAFAPGSAAPAVVKVLAKPPVRKLARDLGVDLSSVTPTGPEGTVTRADVEAAVNPPPAGAAQGPGPAAAPGPPLRALRGDQREVREPVRGVRRTMAQAMVASAFTAPHVTEWVTVDVTRTMRYVERLKGHPDFAGTRVSPLLVVARAVCLAARRTPEVNATWDERAREVVLKRYVNLGIAAATSRGLVVPNIKDADALSLRELAGAIGELTRRAREGRTSPAEMSGGSFTITNVGVFGVDAGTPIINPGESAILCLGAVRKQPWVHKGKVRPRDVTTLSLSFDHRLVDGEKGSRFLAGVAAILEDPANALTY